MLGGLHDLAPAVLAALGAGPTRLGLPRARRVCLLLVDGLGDLLLAEHAALAPTLTGLRAGRLTTGYPSSTPTSLATLSTGAGPGTHGILGVTTLIDGQPLVTLGWEVDGVDARRTLPPQRAQPQPTLFERVRAAGLPALQVAPALFEGSGFTEAILRGGDFRGLAAGERPLAALQAALQEIPAGFVYGYTAALDTAGHLSGPGSQAWLEQLVAAEQLVDGLVQRLPAGTLLLVTGDHGMIAPTDRLDLDDHPSLLRDVDHLAGEPRALALHTARPQAVAERWRSALQGRAEVVARADALAAGWFGPVTVATMPRLGDVLVRCGPDTMVVRSRTDPRVAALVGMHGGTTEAESVVPLLSYLA